MRHEVKKIAKIVDELTTLFLKDDTNEVDFKVVIHDDHSMIRVVDYKTRVTPRYVEYLRKMLNNQRQREIEEYYWQLMGENDEEDELTLISMMTDKAVVELRDGNLYLELIRYK